MEILRKHRMLIRVLSVTVMVAAAFSIFFCEKKIEGLEGEWRALYGLDELWGQQAVTKIRSKTSDLTRYNIEIHVTRTRASTIEVRFCSSYSFFLFGGGWSSGVYRKTGRYPGEYVSRTVYRGETVTSETLHQRTKDLRLLLKCDLTKRNVRIYLDGRFQEEVELGAGPLSDSAGIGIHQGRREAVLQKFIISDGNGKCLFRIDSTPWILLKRASQVFLILSVLILLGLAGLQRSVFKRMLRIVFLALFLEVFLRATYPFQPDLDIQEMRHQWIFETTTNFYGGFNTPGVVRVIDPFGKAKIYPIANPEKAIRVICIGSSPLSPTKGSPDQFFPARLEKELNARSAKKYLVMPLSLHYAENLNGAQVNVFLQEVLSRWKPDFVFYYGMLASADDQAQWKQIERENAFYLRAKKVIDENSAWIKNDRLLYAALEFKKPVREVVYLYDLLCNSYLFMAVENFRKKNFQHDFFSAQEKNLGRADLFFEEVLGHCKANGIQVVFVPALNFLAHENDRRTERVLVSLREEHPEIHVVSLEKVFEGHPDFLLAKDCAHPLPYGHAVMAKELFRQLAQKGLVGKD